MDLNIYKYRNTPVKKTRQYEVRVLSQEGLNQYIQKESYMHNFLQSPAAIYANITNKNEKAKGINFHDAYQIQRPLEDDDKLYHRKRDVISLGRDIVKNRNSLRHSYSQIPNDITQYPQEDLFSPKENLNNSFNNNPKDQNPEEKNKEIENSPNKNTLKVNENSNSNANENKNKEVYNFNDNKKKKEFRQTAKNLYITQNRNIMKNAGSSSFYYSNKYNENYQKSLINLKNNFEGNYFSPNNITNANKLTISGNFKSYEIPNMNFKKDSNNFRVNLLRNKLEKTLLNNPYNFSQNEQENLNDINTNLKNSELNNNTQKIIWPYGDKDINDKIKGENDKLKKYLTLNNHKNENIIANGRKSYYPNLKDIVSSTDLKTSNVKLNNNKYMGERYNPHNYV